VEEQIADRLRGAGQCAHGDAAGVGALEQGPGDQQAAGKNSGDAQDHRDVAALGALFFASIEQHDDEDEEHHDRAGVDDHLHGSHELGAQQQVFDRERSHHHHQRQGAADGVRLREQVDGSRYANGSENHKQDQMQHSLRIQPHVFRRDAGPRYFTIDDR